MFVISLFFGGGAIVLASNDILYGVTSRFIFSVDQSVMGLLFKTEKTCQEC